MWVCVACICPLWCFGILAWPILAYCLAGRTFFNLEPPTDALLTWSLNVWKPDWTSCTTWWEERWGTGIDIDWFSKVGGGRPPFQKIPCVKNTKSMGAFSKSGGGGITPLSPRIDVHGCWWRWGEPEERSCPSTEPWRKVHTVTQGSGALEMRKPLPT